MGWGRWRADEKKRAAEVRICPHREKVEFCSERTHRVGSDRDGGETRGGRLGGVERDNEGRV